MKNTILLEKAANLTGGNRGNGDGKHDLCSLRFLLFRSPLLVSFASTALAATHYVDVNSTNATPPYTNWATAAASIKDAVDAAVAGDEIVVTNGTHPGGVSINKPLTVRSVNGPQFTTISGGGPCVTLASNASLSGFCLTGGYIEVGDGEFVYGARAYGGTLNNCTLTGNSISVSIVNPIVGTTALGFGGGAAYCTLNNCTLTSNSVSATCLEDQSAEALGGGAFYCTLNNCTLSANWVSASRGSPPHLRGPQTSAEGGGAFDCTLNNCTLVGNWANADDDEPRGDGSASGGGASGSTLNNCTLVCNWACASLRSVASFGGASSGQNNCISFGNYVSGYGCEDCVSPGILAGNNWFGDPLFVDSIGWANLRLQSNSPCINAGNNSYVTSATDLDGNPRIAGGTVDIGAYEFQAPVSQISYAWLQDYGLLINAATDTADPDGDGVDNYHEWLASTNPTNRFSSPAQLTITASGVPPSVIILTWSTNAVGFTLQSTTNLVSPIWTTNSPAPVVIAGQNVVTNPISGAQQFYLLVH